MIGKAIYTLLTDDAEVASIVGTGVYPNIAEQALTDPFIVYEVVSKLPTPSKGNTSHIDGIRVQVNSIAKTYNQAQTLADAVRSALDGYSGTPSGSGVALRNVMFDGETDLFQEDDVYGVASDFIFYEKK